MSKQSRIGGSFAPPLTSEMVRGYSELLAAADPRVRDAGLELCEMAHEFLRVSGVEGLENGKTSAHPSGAGIIRELSDTARNILYDVVPWDYECDAMAGVFETIPPGPTRNAAFHLLWYARELTIDRVPITKDKLGG